MLIDVYILCYLCIPKIKHMLMAYALSNMLQNFISWIFIHLFRHDMQDLISLTKDETCAPAVEAQSLSHQITREVLVKDFLKSVFSRFIIMCLSMDLWVFLLGVCWTHLLIYSIVFFQKINFRTFSVIISSSNPLLLSLSSSVTSMMCILVYLMVFCKFLKICSLFCILFSFGFLDSIILQVT